MDASLGTVSDRSGVLRADRLMRCVRGRWWSSSSCCRTARSAPGSQRCAWPSPLPAPARAIADALEITVRRSQPASCSTSCGCSSARGRARRRDRGRARTCASSWRPPDGAGEAVPLPLDAVDLARDDPPAPGPRRADRRRHPLGSRDGAALSRPRRPRRRDAGVARARARNAAALLRHAGTFAAFGPSLRVQAGRSSSLAARRCRADVAGGRRRRSRRAGAFVRRCSATMAGSWRGSTTRWRSSTSRACDLPPARRCRPQARIDRAARAARRLRARDRAAARETAVHAPAVRSGADAGVDRASTPTATLVGTAAARHLGTRLRRPRTVRSARRRTRPAATPVPSMRRGCCRASTCSGGCRAAAARRVPLRSARVRANGGPPILRPRDRDTRATCRSRR